MFPNVLRKNTLATTADRYEIKVYVPSNKKWKFTTEEAIFGWAYTTMSWDDLILLVALLYHIPWKGMRFAPVSNCARRLSVSDRTEEIFHNLNPKNIELIKLQESNI